MNKRRMLAGLAVLVCVTVSLYALYAEWFWSAIAGGIAGLSRREAEHTRAVEMQILFIAVLLLAQIAGAWAMRSMFMDEADRAFYRETAGSKQPGLLPHFIGMGTVTTVCAMVGCRLLTAR